MEIWYSDIINDTNNLTHKQRIFDMVESIVFESNMMFDKLVKKTEGTGIYIPKHLPNRIFKLHNKIQEDKL